MDIEVKFNFQFLSDDWRTADEKSYSANSCGEEVFVENDASSNTFTVSFYSCYFPQ